jgi:hypothetical protein
MVIIATGLIILGGISALMGVKLFRLLLPLIGLVSGIMVGFGGVQAVYGSGVISTTIAVVMAVIVGVIMALLSFLFFELAITILSVIVGATLLSYLGVALGIQDAGFVLFLLAVTGGIMGLNASSSAGFSVRFVTTVTSMIGVSYILAGLLLLAGAISLESLSQTGIIPAVVETVDQSFLWLFVWLAGTILSMNLQYKAMQTDLLSNQFEYAATN